MSSVILKNTRISDNLNFIRGLAALIVMICHLRAALFVGFKSIASPTHLEKIFYFITGSGSEAVMVFFVLSGFLIGSQVSISVKNDIFMWSHYLINRLTRLYVVLIPALLLSGCVVYFGYAIILHQKLPVVLNIGNFLGNIFFLQTIKTYSFAGNSPLWSLSNEFWYYLLFPVLLFTYMEKLPKKFLYLLISIAVFYLIGLEKSLYFIVWLMGLTVYKLFEVKSFKFIYDNVKLRVLISLVPLLGLLFEFTLNRLHLFNRGILDFMAAFFFSIFLYVMLHNKTSNNKSLYHKFSEKTSSCSYTLYLTHYPIVTLMTAILIKNSGAYWIFNALHLLYFILIAVGIFCFSYFFSKITEVHTSQVKLFVFKKFLNK